MKKQCILFVSLLVMTCKLYAVTGQEVANLLSPAASKYGTNALNPRLSVVEQNASISEWNAVFPMAKVFVIDNSKNLVGVKDSDIINAMNALEKANTDLTNAVKVARGISTVDGLKKQRTILENIKKNLVAATNKLSGISMTLANKKDAKNLILTIGRVMEQMIQVIDGGITAKMDAIIPKAPSRPAPALPNG